MIDSFSGRRPLIPRFHVSERPYFRFLTSEGELRTDDEVLLIRPRTLTRPVIVVYLGVDRYCVSDVKTQGREPTVEVGPLPTSLIAVLKVISRGEIKFMGLRRQVVTQED